MKYFKSNKFYFISCSIILINMFINIMISGFNVFLKMNIYDAYLKYAVKGGIYTAIIVIIASVIPIYNKQMIPEKRIQNPRRPTNFMKRYFPKAIKVALVFCVANLLEVLICFIFASKSTPYMGLGYGDFGTFGSIRNLTPMLYVILYIINSCVFGFCFSFFSQSILDFIKRDYLVIIICILYYYLYIFVPFDVRAYDQFILLAPLFPSLANYFLEYNIPIFSRMLGYGMIIITSYVLFHLSCRNSNKAYEHPADCRK